MAIMDDSRFTEAVRRYRNASARPSWNRRELPKFYFAGLLSRRVNLIIDSTEKILEACETLQNENLYFQTADCRIAGIQFLPSVGAERFNNPITLEDVKLMKRFAMTSDWQELGHETRSVSFTTLSAWLGTLRPNDFMPVSTTLYRHSCAYLFNLETTIYESDNIDFFIRAHDAYFAIKRALKHFDFTDTYRVELDEFLRARHPKIRTRNEYGEMEWNWLTQDFLLFVYREMLGFDDFYEMDDRELENALTLPRVYQRAVWVQ